MLAQLDPPELRLRGAEDAVVILHVGAAVAGVLHVQRVVQEVQVFLDLRDMLCGVLLRVQDLREARGVRLRDRREETARPPGTLPPAGPCGHRTEASGHPGAWLGSLPSLGSLRHQHGLQGTRQRSHNRSCATAPPGPGCERLPSLGAPAPTSPPGPGCERLPSLGAPAPASPPGPGCKRLPSLAPLPPPAPQARTLALSQEGARAATT